MRWTTTTCQARLLAALDMDSGVLSWHRSEPGRVAGWWLEQRRQPVHRVAHVTARKLLDRGWVRATRNPGGGRFTGRMVITNMGRRALWLHGRATP